MPHAERLGVLHQFHALLAKSEEAIARIVTEEMGCPISLSRPLQAAIPRMVLESYLELVPALITGARIQIEAQY
jgi:aldehyde dehydrogenase (NAD+)